MSNPLAVATQGLGFGAAQIALQGLLQWVALEVEKYESAGGGGSRRKSRRATPSWLPAVPVEEEEALLLIGIL
jgi:hypothetical protein